MKHALIVGGSKGLGRELAQRLGREGDWRITVLSRSKPDGVLPAVRHVAVDLTDAPRRAAALAQVETPIDALVFAQRYRGKEASWKGEIEVSLTATNEILEWAQAHFAPTGWRSVVLVGSVVGNFVASDQPASYHMAKGGMEALVRYYGVTWGPLGIRVNGVAPSAYIKDETANFHDAHPEARMRMAELTPLQRMGTAADVADAVLFLASDRAGFITGQTLVVDGGMTSRLQTYSI
jgi:NAD(P)-dependent dehydrogenase (short-subunit alcohol dehydrogenase family)